MEFDLIFKVAAVGLTVGILNQLLSKSGKDEYAVLTTLTGLVLVILMLLPNISKVLGELRDVLEI